MIFANPPLVEIVAEMRWLPGVDGAVNPQAGPLTIQFPIAVVEEGFENFRRVIAQKGFTVSERLVPPGFPTLPFTVAQRFRKPSNQESVENYAYQIGMGIFTANALPPYKNWDSFRPIVHEGIETLLATRHSSDKGRISATLRYLDVFTEEFTGGRKSGDFLNDVLGITLTLPPSLAGQVANVHDLDAGLQLTFGLKDRLTMNIGIQQGAMGASAGIIMSTQVSTSETINPDVVELMENLENAHSYIRSTFIGLTTKLHDTMKPVKN